MHEILHFVQNDIRGVFMIATQSLEGEEKHPRVWTQSGVFGYGYPADLFPVANSFSKICLSSSSKPT
jgi:hypothetical protein